MANSEQAKGGTYWFQSWTVKLIATGHYECQKLTNQHAFTSGSPGRIHEGNVIRCLTSLMLSLSQPEWHSKDVDLRRPLVWPAPAALRTHRCFSRRAVMMCPSLLPQPESLWSHLRAWALPSECQLPSLSGPCETCLKLFKYNTGHVPGTTETRCWQTCQKTHASRPMIIPFHPLDAEALLTTCSSFPEIRSCIFHKISSYTWLYVFPF